MPLIRHVFGYHRGHRTPPPERRMAYGIELELEGLNSRREVVDTFPELEVGDHPPPAFEVDASLSSKGVEVIFPPISAKQIKDPQSYINRAITTLRERRVVKPSNGAGMHINVNMRHLDNSINLLMAVVVHTMPRDRLTAIGGRPLNRYCSQRLGLGNGGLLITQVRIELGGHNSAANPLPDRLEMRYPVGSVDPGHIKRNIEFIEVLLRFSKSEEGRAVRYVREAWPAFRDWLQVQERADARRIKKILLPD